MRHNQVYLCGVIQDKPKIRRQGTKALAEFRLITITGRRSGGLQLNTGEYDVPLVVTADPVMVDEADKIEVGDMVIVKGSFTTTKVTKTPRCPYCGEKQHLSGMIAYISPACITISARGICINPRTGVFDKEFAAKALKEVKEISNYATIIGVVAQPPQAYKSVGDKKRRIVSYQIAVKRKFRIVGNLEDAKIDYPWVKSYGKIGINDARYIRKGTYIFVDGWVRSRKFDRTETCQHCGSTFQWKDTSQEIIPYATEYLKNYNEVSNEEEEIRKDVEEIYRNRKKIINESDIENDKIEDDEAQKAAAEELKKLDFVDA